jgi:lipoprotein-anchoring transpeptidase ErfK/SrfK
MKHNLLILAILIATAFTFNACQNDTIKKIRAKINIKNLFSKLKKESTLDKSDTANLFDNDNYDPSKIDSIDIQNSITTIYESDSAIIKKIGIGDTNLLNKTAIDVLNDTAILKRDSFTNDIKKVTAAEMTALKYNLDQLKSNLKIAPIDSNAKRKTCKIWADVNKTDQRLYLYVEGNCVDTFKISSGDTKHTTPNFDRRPCGPQFAKYTSKKYPGGNYNGFGNMPYVLFVQGGYGLHGTTIGNIKKLGTRASHGCVRLHPDNAKIIFELVKAAGVENTWVTIRD